MTKSTLQSKYPELAKKISISQHRGHLFAHIDEILPRCVREYITCKIRQVSPFALVG